MKAWRWTGAAYVECDSLPLTDRAFRYGMSVFESLRVSGGEAEFFDRHLSRLVQACAERGIAVEESVLAAGEELLRADGGNGFARIYVTAGDGAPKAPAEHGRVIVFLEKRQPPASEEAWEIGLHEETHQPLFGGLKTGNYWFHCEALAQAARRGYDETLLFNDRAELISACMANVFLVREERLSTPAR